METSFLSPEVFDFYIAMDPSLCWKNSYLESNSIVLDRMLLHPGGAFPLSNVNMVAGVVTCSGKMSIVLEYAEEAIDSKTMIQIKDKVMERIVNFNA